MIDKQTLKKLNLKAVPFSCIGEGETFNVEGTFRHPMGLARFKRKIEDELIVFADGWPIWSAMTAGDYANKTVYVPVWRPCKEVAK